MKLKLTIFWVLAILGILAVSIPPFFITSEAFSGNPTILALGRFHVLLLHFPIALLLVAPLLEGLGLFSRWRHLRKAVPSVLILCAIFSIATTILGLLLAAGEGIQGSLVQSHMLAGISFTILIICLAVIRSTHVERGRPKALLSYCVLLVSGIGILSFGSHQGASLIHGHDYLFEYLPPELQAIAGYNPKQREVVTYDSIAYDALIVPILQQNCYTCHDDSVTKGGLRMDSLAGLLSGGESGHPAIVAGDSGVSELYQRITLDRDNDKAMPPIEKKPLGPEDISLLQWWIDTGAEPGMTVADLTAVSYPEEVETILNSLMFPEHSTTPLDWDILSKVARDSKANYGIDVIPYTQDPVDGVYIATRNAGQDIGADALAGLREIAGHVHSINLWNRTLQDDALAVINAFTNLRELHLNQTNINNDDLGGLASLRRLEVLNLHGTAVDNESIPILSGIRPLRKLYLSDTRIDRSGVSQLREALPGCEIVKLDPQTALTEVKPPIRLEFAQFKSVPNWGLQNVPSQDHGMGSTHGGIAIDKAGTIYVSSHTGIHLFDPDGNHLQAFTGPDYADIHAMCLVEENGTEYIYAARNRNAEALKLTTAGDIVLKIPFPEGAVEDGKFMPTAVARTVDGRIVVTDGYGSNRVFIFDQEGTFLSTFGGLDPDDVEKFRTPHGISLDTRYDPIRLLISDREKRRLVHFDLQGNFIGEVATDLRRPCTVSILGKYIAVAELEGRVIILNGNNEILHTLGDNPDKEQRAKFKVDPADWQDGIHTAPHGLAWDEDGNLYVQDWNSHGRITKWKRITEGSSY